MIEREYMERLDRERAADLMAEGANAFKDYMFFSDEQDRSSFPTDNLAAQCAFVLGHLPAPACALRASLCSRSPPFAVN